MKLRDFLVPKKKVFQTIALTFGLFIATLFIASFLGILGVNISPTGPILSPYIELMYNLPITILLVLLMAYAFSCSFFNIGKKRIIIYYFITFFVFFLIIFYSIELYNNTVGRYCNIDSECFIDAKYRCGNPHNENYISLAANPFINRDCFTVPPILCIQNKCERFDVIGPNYYDYKFSSNDCDRIDSGSYQDTKNYCYYVVSIKTNDISVCDKITDQQRKQRCIEAASK